ncbi:hypothetical protein OG749_20920 [Streptomyces nojiriensis]|uniref:hypothetical protein n=1 Tax=Streptomyces nojiriensis TaxID=66374 RepID=UPI002E1732FE
MYRSHCHPHLRLGGELVLQERLRDLAQLVYPYRADSESVHSQFDLSLWNRRMIACGVERQKLLLLGFALSQKATSHQLHLSKAA